MSTRSCSKYWINKENPPAHFTCVIQHEIWAMKMLSSRCSSLTCSITFHSITGKMLIQSSCFNFIKVKYDTGRPMNNIVILNAFLFHLVQYLLSCFVVSLESPATCMSQNPAQCLQGRQFQLQWSYQV